MTSQTAEHGRTDVTLPADDQVMITRHFASSCAHVCRAWTEPDLVRRWWSGAYGTVVSADIDLHVGGTWRWVMEVAGGVQVAFHGEYRELVPDCRIVTTSTLEGRESSGLVNTIEFIDVDGRCRLSMLQQHAGKDQRDAHVASWNGVPGGGMLSSLDALEDILNINDWST